VIVVVAPGDGGLELSESLAESATRLGQTPGPEEDKRDAEQDDQVGGLQ